MHISLPPYAPLIVHMERLAASARQRARGGMTKRARGNAYGALVRIVLLLLAFSFLAPVTPGFAGAPPEPQGAVAAAGDGMAVAAPTDNPAQAIPAFQPAQNVRYVRLQSRSVLATIQLAEVQVFSGATNVSQGKTATQSSTFSIPTSCPAPVAGNAVDGNTDGVYADCSVAHTEGQAYPWWQVNLGSPQTVDHIVVWGRTDPCCTGSLNTLDVEVSSDGVNFTSVYYQGANPAPARWDIWLVARYVRVQTRHPAFLSLAEVQVLKGNTNLALNKPATQSSTGLFPCGGTADKAVDGDTNGDFAHCSVTHTTGNDPQPWWQVDLGSSQTIDRVVLWNRTDCCGDRLSDFDVLVSGDGVNFTSAYYRAAPAPTRLEVWLGVRYLKVRLRQQGILQLAEVQVFNGSGTNVAVGKPATQSSTLGPFSPCTTDASASKAVDGNTNGDFYAACSVSHTNGTEAGWWQVDLGTPAAVDHVALWNRTDCCGERLTNFDVSVSPDGVSYAPVYYQPGTAGVTTDITQSQPSSIADLSALTLSGVTLAPAFAAATTSYTASVANATASTTVNATSADPWATVTINGVAATSKAVTLAAGANTITVAVTAANGTVKTYTVAVSRAKSSNADLSGLSLKAGSSGGSDIALSPAFASGTTSYTVTTVSGSAVYVAATADPTASVVINGVSGATKTVALSTTGTTNIDVTVTAQDGTTVKAYSVSLPKPLSNNNKLSTLIVQNDANGPNLPVSPSFNPDTLSYAVNLPPVVVHNRVYLTATPAGNGATVVVNNSTAPDKTWNYITPPTGTNTVSAIIVVTAEDGSQRTYNFTFYPASWSDAHLKNLQIGCSSCLVYFTDNITGITRTYTQTVTMTPGFSSNTLNYSLSSDFSFVNINITKRDTRQTFTIGAGSNTTYEQLVDNSTSPATAYDTVHSSSCNPCEPGSNLGQFFVDVIAPNGTTTVRYTVSLSFTQHVFGTTALTSDGWLDAPLASEQTVSSPVNRYAPDARLMAAGGADTTPPEVVVNVTGTLGQNGWYTSDVAVEWYALEDGSPVTAMSPGCVNRTIGEDTPASGVTLTCTVTSAGGTATKSITIKRDANAPLVDAAVLAGGLPQAFGVWAHEPLTVHFTCSDVSSGLAGSCPADQVVTADGATTVSSGPVCDLAGNCTSVSTTARIDRIGPVLSLPNGLSVTTSGSGVLVTYSASASDAASGVLRDMTCSRPSGTWFPVGTRTVTCSVLDQAGNGSSGSFDVTVNFVPPARLNDMPGNITTVADDATGAGVAYTAPTASDGSTVTCTPAPDSSFPLGTTPVTCTTPTGLSATFLVTVRLADAPIIDNIPSPAAVEATSAAGATVSYSAPTAQDTNGASVPVACAPVSGSTFPVGSTPVTCTATAGATTSSAGFLAVVVDTSAPVVTAPANVAAEATSASGANVSYGAATASDAVGVAGGVACAPASGSLFPLGSTVVVCSAKDAAGNQGLASFIVAVRDTSAPVITASATVNGNPYNGEWTNQPVTVTFTCADPNSTGVASNTVTSPVVVSGQGGEQTVTSNGLCRDFGGNPAAPVTYGPINLDKTAPAIAGSRAPAANANGWNNTDVTVTFTCADEAGGSGLAACSAPTTLTADGAGQSVTGTAADTAGNTASVTVGGINLDKTKPVAAPAATPVANGAGWNNSDVTVAWNWTDGGAGTDPAACTTSSASTGEGTITLTASCTDKAGNTGSATYSVKVDKTAAELYNQFDPATKDVLVFARDGGSGVPTGPLTPVTVTTAQWGDGDDGDDDHNWHDRPDGDDKRKTSADKPGKDDDRDRDGNPIKVEVRTYTVTDAAGNTTTLVEKVKKAGHELKVRMVSVQYNGGPVVLLAKNSKHFEWSTDRSGAIKELEQKMTAGSGKDRRSVDAKYQADKNQTRIETDGPGPDVHATKPGLALLRLATTGGKLTIEY